MESGGGGNRRRRSPSDEKIDSPNLRDFLQVKEDRDGRNLAGLTLGAVIGAATKARRDGRPSKTSSASAAPAPPGPPPSLSRPPTSPSRTANRMISRRNSTRFPTINSEYQLSNPELSSSSLSSINGGDNTNHAEFNSMSSNRAMLLRGNSSRIPSLAASRYGRETEASTSLNTSERNAVEPADLPSEDEEEEEREDRVAEREEAPVRTSLMALAGGDRWLCSRELWVQRGNCPLCNGFILEILDIF
ncbi:RING/U-box superfamily protein [Actinidia rufa]|uniref:RING/U-box superfamily protein n=1 Tax=Actinidia rufa TaxID=165716 RepID=A0A7J0HAL9_9ERIC|nr:RING/U-box superfamily protein [Actinidia rufa]